MKRFVSESLIFRKLTHFIILLRFLKHSWSENSQIPEKRLSTFQFSIRKPDFINFRIPRRISEECCARIALKFGTATNYITSIFRKIYEFLNFSIPMRISEAFIVGQLPNLVQRLITRYFQEICTSHLKSGQIAKKISLIHRKTNKSSIK